MRISHIDICDTCGQRVIPERDPESSSFPTTEERLREAEQCLLEAGQMLGDMDRQVRAAEHRASAAAEAHARAVDEPARPVGGGASPSHQSHPSADPSDRADHLIAALGEVGKILQIRLRQSSDVASVFAIGLGRYSSLAGLSREAFRELLEEAQWHFDAAYEELGARPV